MKIIYVTASLPYGATEVFAIPEVRELVARGHEVRLVPMSRYTPTPHSDAAPFVPTTIYHPLLSAPVLRTGASELVRHPGKALRSLFQTLKGQKPNVIVKNLSVFPRGLWLARLARTWGAEHIHAYWASVPATAALIAGEVSGVPWSFTAHRWDIVEPNAFAAKVQSSSFSRFISRDGLALAKPVAGEELAHKAALVRMGVRLDAHEPKVTSPPAGTDLRAVCVAALIPRKGHRYLLEAVSGLRTRGLRVELKLAGEGEARPQLEAQIAQLGLGDQVTLLGSVDHSRLLEWYAEGRFDCCVLPSLHEGIAVAIIEAMSYGLPVVATDVGGTRELLSGEAGVLVPAKDPQRLEEAMETLAKDESLRQRMGETGRRRVMDEYNIEGVVDTLLRLYETGTRESRAA